VNRLQEYGFAAAMAAACTAVCFAMFRHFELTNLVMVYILGTLAVAARGHRGPAAFYSASSVLCFDFFFVPPRFTFSVSDVQYIWTFAVMFATAMTISHLTIRLREEAEVARQGEERSAWLMEKAKKAELEAESERLRSSLLSSVSHDFRTPLTTIVGSAGALLEKDELAKSPKTRELLENIQAEGERLSHLVQNLLETTRLESGAVHLEKEKYPLEEVVGSVLERLKKSIQDRKVKVDIPENLPLVPIEATLIEQVLTNLLENAVRHTPRQSALEISAGAEGDAVVVTVADHGPGLKTDELERVFDKFYHDPSSPGAGLGLAICRAVVNAHGGRIWAENRKGGGAVFRFTLPLESPHGH
jgi:two-component system sensor histidine kinase KdpD